METNSNGDELLKTSSKETNCLETKVGEPFNQALSESVYFTGTMTSEKTAFKELS